VTAVVAVPDRRRSRYIFGADSAITDDTGRLTITYTPKVRAAGPYLLGAAGDGPWFITLSAVRWPDDNGRFGAGWLENGGLRDAILKAENELGIKESEGDALVAWGLRIWLCETGGDVNELGPGAPHAIGSGRELALGWLDKRRGKPRELALGALEFTSAHRADVAGPFVII
jgi:hypothetical protein